MDEKRAWFWAGFLLTTTFLLGGCGGSSSGDGTRQSQNETSDNQSTLTNSLVRVASNDDFERYLKNGIEQASEQDDTAAEVVLTPIAVGLPADSAIESAAADVSSTNLIVAGVDEADLMKTDGRYLYVVKPTEYLPAPDDVNITTEPAALLASPVFYPPQERKPPAIRISEISTAPASSSQLLDLEVGENSTTLRGLYLATNERDDDLLIAVGQEQPNWSWGRWASPWYWQSGNTKLWFYNVNEPTAPQQSQQFDIEGHLLASRRVGNQLYLVTRFTPDPPNFIIYPADATQRDNNRQVLSDLSVTDLLPTVSINNAAPRPLVDPDNCFVPDTTRTDTGYPTIVTVSVIDLNSPGEINSVCYGGSSEGFYATTKSLYFTKTVWGDLIVADSIAAGPSSVSRASQPYTLVHKFSLGSGVPVYQGSGRVEGAISGNPAFMMGEVGDVLHVISSAYRPSSWEYDYRLTSLKQRENSNELVEIAHLPNEQRPDPIGKPGEQLYSSRFIGDRAYLVTFKKVDPLYVLDLSVAGDPAIAGELEIPGFSSYLHPVGDNLLLGVGKDAIADESRGFAWYQGLKVSLFDVADMSAPKELGVISIGERGTETSLAYDHRAIAYLAGSGGNPDRLTIPVQVHSGEKGSEPWSIARWTHTGLYLFEINRGSANSAATLSQTGSLLKAENSDDSQYWGASTHNDRAIIQGSAVHYLYDGEVQSADWEAVVNN
ncbi:MAG: hypothetical protein GXP10_07760 [Gammaproteobacteria bacterium]|nr:hypothetical protein [Gammaproteobacteria bacterium]